jgi:hypothetical protein
VVVVIAKFRQLVGREIHHPHLQVKEITEVLAVLLLTLRLAEAEALEALAVTELLQ